jgi:LAS superfamily LD-carboxypeptidase LdcB
MPEQDLFPLFDNSSKSEPVAVNRIKKNNKRIKMIIAIVLAVIVLACILSLYFIFGNSAKADTPFSLPTSFPEIIVSSTQESSSQLTSSSNISQSLPQSSDVSIDSSHIEIDTIPRDEWYMVLVNHNNPLPDGFDVPVDPIDNNGRFFDVRAIDALMNLLDASVQDGLQAMVISGSRSWEFQQGVFDNRVAALRATGLTAEEAEEQALNENLAPGESEHNSALAVDVVSVNNQRMDEDYLENPIYTWLLDNAADYGFIQRYPIDKANITGVEFEPWHFRYVGVEQARLIKESGMTLEEYLA